MGAVLLSTMNAIYSAYTNKNNQYAMVRRVDMYQSIKKRNGKVVAFDLDKIEGALLKAGDATGEYDLPIAKQLAKKMIVRAEKEIKSKTPTVEQIQDIAEEILLDSRYKKTAKAYIIYRDQHEKIRELTSAANIDHDI